MTELDKLNSYEDYLSRLAVMLVRPAYAGNVGSVARVMSNFDCKQGFLISPRCDINSIEARQYATGASAVTLATLQVIDSVSDRFSEFHSVIAVSRRTGMLRKQTIDLDAVAERLKFGKVALVFGPEESGLNDDEVKNCSHVLSLNVSEKVASVNLSHAVAIVLSKIFQDVQRWNLESNADENDLSLSASAVDLQGLQMRLLESLSKHEKRGHISNAERFSRILSQSLTRANLDETELSAWHGIISLLSRP